MLVHDSPCSACVPIEHVRFLIRRQHSLWVPHFRPVLFCMETIPIELNVFSEKRYTSRQFRRVREHCALSCIYDNLTTIHLVKLVYQHYISHHMDDS